MHLSKDVNHHNCGVLPGVQAIIQDGNKRGEPTKGTKGGNQRGEPKRGTKEGNQGGEPKRGTKQPRSFALSLSRPSRQPGLPACQGPVHAVELLILM